MTPIETHLNFSIHEFSLSTIIIIENVIAQDYADVLLLLPRVIKLKKTNSLGDYF